MISSCLIKVHYAPRNPELTNNWRGKKRDDKKDIYFGSEQNTNQSITHLIENAELEEKPENDGSNEEYAYNERVFEMAMKRGLSIWRSHTGIYVLKGAGQTTF